MSPPMMYGMALVCIGLFCACQAGGLNSMTHTLTHQHMTLTTRHMIADTMAAPEVKELFVAPAEREAKSVPYPMSSLLPMSLSCLSFLFGSNVPSVNCTMPTSTSFVSCVPLHAHAPHICREACYPETVVHDALWNHGMGCVQCLHTVLTMTFRFRSIVASCALTHAVCALGCMLLCDDGACITLSLVHDTRC